MTSSTERPITDRDRTYDTVSTTSSPTGGAVTAGILSLIVNVIVTYLVSLAFPTVDLGWAITLVAISSFFAGFFGYYGAFRQNYAT